jgi:hypothetical protein
MEMVRALGEGDQKCAPQRRLFTTGAGSGNWLVVPMLVAGFFSSYKDLNAKLDNIVDLMFLRGVDTLRLED